MYGALLAMTPLPRSEKPAWALAFKRRREEAVGSQEELAARADVSQSLISQIERGVQVPTGISMDRFGRLLDALNWSAAEFSQATGLDIPFAVPSSSEPHPPAPDPHDFTVEVPAALLEAAEIYKAIDPLIAHPVVQQQIARAGFFGGGPQTPQQWIRYFNDVREWIKVDN